MLNELTALTNLAQSDFFICIGAVFLAGLVRGFAGFALSAVTMACLVVILPPIELIPICFVLEGVASIVMFRGGKQQANMKMVWGLVIGSAVGTPIGLYATTSIPTEMSKLVALIVLLTLTVLQFFSASPRFLTTKSGLYASGVIAGIVTGLASIGGMVVALYVLASKAEPGVIRASLVMFLAIGMFTSLGYLLAFGVMNTQAFIRGAVFAPVVLGGIFIGSGFFRPSLVVFYKQICLTLLVVLSLIGLSRMF